MTRLEPGRREIDPVDKGVDEPHRIIGADIIVHASGATFHTVCLISARRMWLFQLRRLRGAIAAAVAAVEPMGMLAAYERAGKR